MAYLVDTNILSQLRKRQRCNPGVAAWFDRVSASELYLSVLTLGEIWRGIELLRPRDPVSARHLEKWLRGLEQGYEDRIVPVTAAIAIRWGRLSPGQPLPVIDGLLAATALERDMTLVTRNMADIARSGVNCLNPFA